MDRVVTMVSSISPSMLSGTMSDNTGSALSFPFTDRLTVEDEEEEAVDPDRCFVWAPYDPLLSVADSIAPRGLLDDEAAECVEDARVADAGDREEEEAEAASVDSDCEMGCDVGIVPNVCMIGECSDGIRRSGDMGVWATTIGEWSALVGGIAM